MKGYTNEIDIIAVRGNDRIAVECKNHTSPGATLNFNILSFCISTSVLHFPPVIPPQKPQKVGDADSAQLAQAGDENPARLLLQVLQNVVIFNVAGLLQYVQLYLPVVDLIASVLTSITLPISDCQSQTNLRLCIVSAFSM